MNRPKPRSPARAPATALLIAVLLAACSAPVPPPAETLFTEPNAWGDDAPADAEIVTPDAFRRGVDAGELVLANPATIAAQGTSRDATYRADRELLRGEAEPSSQVQALLAEAARTADYEGDRPVTLEGDQTVVLFGVGSQLRNAAEAYERARDPANALADYALGYALAPAEVQAELPAPDALEGRPLTEVQAALARLDELLGGEPAILGRARLEAGGPAAPPTADATVAPGNGRDNDGPCTPTGLAARYWFPLKNFVSPVKNQASRGTCWAFTAIGALESRERVQNDARVDLSEQFLVNKVKEDWDESDYTDGYWSERALETALAERQVMAPESAWTYNGATARPRVQDGDQGSYARSCDGYGGTCSDTAHQSRRVCTTVIFTFCGYAGVTHGGPGVAASRTVQVWRNGDRFDLNRIRLLLAQGHVLMASFPVYRGFMDDVGADGVVRNYAATRLDAMGREVAGSYGGHAVQIVGFLSNDDMAVAGTPANIGGGGYFVVKNSWGCRAGDGGYYYLPADYVSRHFSTLSALVFDGRRSDAWNREQAAPGGTEAPRIALRADPARVDLRVETDLAAFFRVTHPVAKGVALRVVSDRDGTLYDGPWSTDSGALVGSSLKRTFAAAGRRTLTLVASYGSSRAQAALRVDVVNTPPTLTLNHSGEARQGEPYAITALVRDLNDADAAQLCAATRWEVDAPDALASATGCAQLVTFGATGGRSVRVATRDREGATAERTLTLEVLPPPENPYPRVVSAGVYGRDFLYIEGQIVGCSDVAVAEGGTVDFREDGCNLSVSLPTPKRYSAAVQVENPAGEALTYDWRVHATIGGTETVINTALASPSPSFVPYSPGNAIEVTNDCRVSVTVNAPDPARSKSLTVWTGRCTYDSTRLN